jgi:hypothetical protein
MFLGELAWVRVLERKRKMRGQSTWDIILLRTVIEV